MEQGEEEKYEDCGRYIQPTVDNGRRYTLKIYAVDDVGNVGEPVQLDWLVGGCQHRYQGLSRGYQGVVCVGVCVWVCV